MVEAASTNAWLHRRATVAETLTSSRQAAAEMIVTLLRRRSQGIYPPRTPNLLIRSSQWYPLPGKTVVARLSATTHGLLFSLSLLVSWSTDGPQPALSTPSPVSVPRGRRAESPDVRRADALELQPCQTTRLIGIPAQRPNLTVTRVSGSCSTATSVACDIWHRKNSPTSSASGIRGMTWTSAAPH